MHIYYVLSYQTGKLMVVSIKHQSFMCYAWTLDPLDQACYLYDAKQIKCKSNLHHQSIIQDEHMKDT